MTLRQLPKGVMPARPKNLEWSAPADVLAKWADTPRAATEGEDVISILDVIGEDWWTGGGFTAKRMSAALRSIGDKPVRVQLNTPGGDLFEGIAIYNMLRDHKQKVTVEVLGWAASAGSIIAMAGDEIVMGTGTFIMVHNAWGLVVGNRHDLAEAATLFESFDSAIVDIYDARVSADRKTIESLMDAETFMGPTEAIKHGFADRTDADLGKDAEAKALAGIDPGLVAKRRTEAALARSGFTRNQRADMLAELTNSPGARDAARPTATRDAGVDMAAIQQLINTLKS